MVLENAGALLDFDSGGSEFEPLRGALFRWKDRSQANLRIREQL